MDRQYPIYTVETECQDCFKCVRHCPVKAIRVVDGRASVVPELCIACGRCVAVCPAAAKKVRDDLGRARHLVSSRRRVYASLAPSWVSEFDGVDAGAMIAALRALGFAGVGETALGAQQVSMAMAEALADGNREGLLLSSACPACVNYVQKYHPRLTPAVAPMLSPALAHARMLRESLGDEIGVIFIGPCIAKKLEADRRPDLMNIALTFQELRRWFDIAGVHPEPLAGGADDRFVLGEAAEGALYPIEGGMIDTIRHAGGDEDVEFVTLSGMTALAACLTGLDDQRLRRKVMIECLACEGGCVHGPASRADGNALLDRIRILDRAARPDPAEPRRRVVAVDDVIRCDTAPGETAGEDELRAALGRIGKTRPEDELNCGGCGYDTCRAFAAAMLAGKAEPAMCVSFLRRQAHRKANALLRCMPTGAVVVDADLRVIECNEPFARLFGAESMMAFNASNGMAGAKLEKVLPFADLFGQALHSGADIHRDHLVMDEKLLNVTVFTIEPRQVVGGIVEDVTRVEMRREKIARQAREVINRNVATVQEIAYQLGEHMADTEILLRSIADDYADVAADDDDQEARP